MLNSLHHRLNWQAPWYHMLAIPPFSDVCYVKDWLNTTLPKYPPITNYQHIPIQFVSQDDLPPNIAYESFIAQTGQIPTRDNFHDLLGGLIWLNYPKTKAVLNQLHQADIEAHGITAKRTPIRNLLTLFDENGGVVVSSDKAVLQALQSFDWQTALLDKRDDWLKNNAPFTLSLSKGEIPHLDALTNQFFPFGHALLEKLITPRNNITAHVILLYVEEGWLSQDTHQQRQTLDVFLSQFFMTTAKNEPINSKMFQPLPVMGIPDFCEPQNLAFYQDKTVFRAARNALPSKIYTLQKS